MKKLFLFVILTIYTLSIHSQVSTTQADFKIHIKKAIQNIKIDGVLDEADWTNAEKATNFQVHYPQNGQTPRFQTEARVTYDNHFLYIGFVCYDSGKHVIQTLKRDVDSWESEGAAVVLEPNCQQINGFFFSISSEGVQSEALLTSGDNQMSFEWDNKWFSEVKKGVDKWTAEIAIPFKTLRYNGALTTWNINFIRNYPKGGQWHTWTKIPIAYNGISLAHTGSMIWDATPPLEKSNTALIPYVNGSISKDYIEKTPTYKGANIGLDAKIALNSNLNLDATINPDFSQIEVDEQVTNLTRFNIFYPERRTFFLENSDILSQFGIPPMRPFFSRTIGLNSNAQAVPILYGLRLSGNLTNKIRVNAFNMHTKEKGSDLGQNFSAMAFQKNFLGRSFIKAGFLNRQSFTKFESSKTDYGRNALLSLAYISKDNHWEAWAEGHHSFKPGITKKNNMTTTGFLWRNDNWEIIQDLTTIGSNYYADMGFINRIENYDAQRDTVVRLGFYQNFNEFNYNVRPKEGPIAEHAAGLENFLVFNPNGSLNEWFDRLRYFITFRNTSELKLRIDNNIVNLPYPFSFSEENALLKAQKYKYTYGIIQYDSDRRKTWSWGLQYTAGEFYNGSRVGIRAGINYRIQPWGNFSVKMDWNRVTLPPLNGYDGVTTLLLLSPKAEINFNRNMFWTTFFQFNTQANNFNINSRFQWRFRPMSDLFVVYTDNYFAKEEFDGFERFRPFQTKSKAFVLKLTYWLNL